MWTSLFRMGALRKEANNHTSYVSSETHSDSDSDFKIHSGDTTQQPDAYGRYVRWSIYKQPNKRKLPSPVLQKQ